MGLPTFSQLLAIEGSHLVTADLDDAKHWQDFQHDVATLHDLLANDTRSRWALCLDDSYHMAVACLALAHAGKTIIIPGNLRPSALAELSDAFDGVITDSAAISLQGKASVTLPVDAAQSCLPLPHFNDEDVQLILYTSGSSGTPKAIEKSLHQLNVEVDTLENTWADIVHGSEIVSTVSHQHIYGLLFRVFWPLFARRPFARSNINYLQQTALNSTRPLTLISSPAQLKRLNPVDPAFYCAAVFSSGGPLPYAAAQCSLSLLGQLPFEVFGSTETGGIAYRQQENETTRWQLFEGIHASINNNGCLSVKSPYIDPHSFYETADLCDFNSDGTFSLLGRADRIVKIEEKRVSLSDVESRLVQHPWISDAACIPLDEDGRQFIAAAITLNHEGATQMASQDEHALRLSIRKLLTQWLDNVAIPRRFILLDSIPQNSQGKRQHAIIESLFTDDPTALSPQRLPSLVKAETTTDQARLHLNIDNKLPEFCGHFPRFPIYPGVSQIDAVLRFAKDLFPIHGQFSSINKLKFEAPVWPGTQLVLTLSWHAGTKKLTFRYESDQGLHTRGVVSFI
ncbi:AMP-binding protein [Enterovibrio sp. ZSDZ35]|uniref:AMP-binding protein n=1 Tax=Enterovibrio qingdaonensis TaxID=2899818 RepID=A0ABT5QQF1_9GAMM|nr:AMP-binding protein [Enterovibrio sp. ZSDZ35]MDD1782928.1 AMP-binding protein [Enterovibrio sp. ZSDZ35]